MNFKDLATYSNNLINQKRELTAVQEKIVSQNGKFDSFLLDLGYNIEQVIESDYGLSYQVEGPIDMRYDSSADIPTAAEIVH